MRRTLSLLFVSMFVPAVAAAQTEPAPSAEATATVAPSDPLAKENWPLSGVDRPLGLTAGMLQLDVNGAMSLTKDNVGKPFGTPLAVYYGITNELQVALGSALCLSGKENNCAKVLDAASVQLLYSLFGRGSSLEVGTFATLNYASIDDGALNVQVGGAINWVTGGGNVAIIPQPNVAIGLAKRDSAVVYNKETIGVPISAYFRAGEKVAPVLFTGLGQTALDGFGDAWSIPVGVGVLIGLNSMFDVGARFDMPYLLAADAIQTGDARSATVWFSVRPL